MDEQGGHTAKAQNSTKAIQSLFRQKVYAFYTSTSKQVLDIHEEASGLLQTPNQPRLHLGRAKPAV
ncbi:hypothetical protein RhiJN_20308 [Ceratobasidium sp. AG-Ba]|nr:hypothetical protein RhiJN_20308 [Ceratobasidium sp. AG-Ba]